MKEIRRPPAKCPKCGHVYGFLGVHPTYESAAIFDGSYASIVEHPERLRWECVVCGYTQYTPPADAADA